MGSFLRRTNRLRSLCVSAVVAYAVRCGIPGRDAHAEALSDVRSTAPLRLEVSLLDAPEPPTLRRRLESWFPDGTSLVIQSLAPSAARPEVNTNRDTVAIWIALPSADQADITYGFRETMSNRYRFVRSRVALRRGLDELGQERLARVIHSSVMALLQGRVQEVGVAVDALAASERSARPAPPENLAVALPQESPYSGVIRTEASAVPVATVRIIRRSVRPAIDERARRGWLAVGYAATLRGQEGMALGPELTLGWRTVRLRHASYGLFLDTRLIVPSNFEIATLRIQTSGARFRLAADLEVDVGSSWALELALGAGIDINHYVPSQSTVTTIAPNQPGTDAQLCLTPSLRLWTVATLEIGLGAHLDVLSTNGRYYTSPTDSVGERVVVPWRLQPGFSVTLRWPGRTP